MTILQSQDWSESHLEVNEALSTMLNDVRELGYNPSLHMHYDNEAHRLVLDEELRQKHPALETRYQQYQNACDRRDEALTKIQALPKLDIGF